MTELEGYMLEKGTIKKIHEKMDKEHKPRQQKGEYQPNFDGQASVKKSYNIVLAFIYWLGMTK